MTDLDPTHPARRRSLAVMIAAAATVTVLDGFDAFSLSLMMPAVARDLHIQTTALGPIFASAMGGMILGAFAGGALADKIGRVPALLLALLLFGGAALTMPFVAHPGEIIANRLIAGIGLGAAAPIAVALLNQGHERPPSAFVISLVWVGIGMGGMVAALFNYLFAARYGWRLIFVVGGAAALPAAACVAWSFRGLHKPSRDLGTGGRARLYDLFADGMAWRTIGVAGMFFFGFITTSIIVNWLPTILSHRAASPLTISVSFAGVNGGAVVVTAWLGWLASRGSAGVVRTLAWGAAAVCGAAITLAASSTAAIAILAVTGAMIGAGGQALSIALANDLHRARGLQSSSIGFMAGSGRLGQFCALGISSTVVGWTGRETMVFGLAAFTAAIAALLSAAVGARAGRPATPLSIDLAGDAHA